MFYNRLIFYFFRKFTDSVGFILQNLHSMSVMPTDLIQEEDEIDNAKLQNVASDLVLDSSETVTNVNSNTPVDIDIENDVSFTDKSCDQLFSKPNLNTLSKNSNFEIDDNIGGIYDKNTVCCEVMSDINVCDNFNTDPSQEDDRKVRNTLKRR